MSRSVFVKQSQSPESLRQEIRSRLGSGLALEGPFSDVGGSLKRIAGTLRSLVSQNRSPLDVTMNAMIPFNLSDAALGVLDVPFVLGSSFSDGFKGDCAGAIASGEAHEFEGRKVRPVDGEELNLVAIALLRRLGIESHYSYAHFNGSTPEAQIAKRIAEDAGLDLELPSPAILLPEGNPRLIIIMPPAVLPCPSGTYPVSTEVLDDDALQSIIRLKLAALSSEALMREVAEGAESYPGEWIRKAKDIGHMLHYGISGWDVMEARREASSSSGDGGGVFESIRDVADGRHVRFVKDPLTQMTSAARMIFDSETQQKFFSNLDEAICKGEFGLSELLMGIDDHGMVGKLKRYVDLAKLSNDHIHPADSCKERSTLN